MSRSDVSVIERSVEATNTWLAQIAAELGGEDRRYAYHALRAFLHTLRDRLTVDEAAQLAAQLPVMIRGIYYEGWDPSSTPRPYHTVAEFLAAVERELGGEGETEASYAVEAAARVLCRHVSAGEIEDVLAVLPGELRGLITQ